VALATNRLDHRLHEKVLTGCASGVVRAMAAHAVHLLDGVVLAQAVKGRRPLPLGRR